MRSDMGKVIIDLPRNQHRDKYRDVGSRNWNHNQRRNPLDESPKREKMSMGRGTKYFSDRLNPLRKYLEKQVGRPWDEVWSEICKKIPADGKMQIHARNHVWDLVAKDVFVGDDGGVYLASRRTVRIDVVTRQSWRNDRLYICPKTGILKRPVVVPVSKKVIQAKRRKSIRGGDSKHRLQDGRDLFRLNGAWFVRTYYTKKVWHPKTVWDGNLERYVVVKGEGTWIDRHGCKDKQLSKKEIRDLVPSWLK